MNRFIVFLTATVLPPCDSQELNFVTPRSIVCRRTGIPSLPPNRNLHLTSGWSLMQQTLGGGSCVRRGWALTELLSVPSRISRNHARPILERAASLRLKAGGERKKNDARPQGPQLRASSPPYSRKRQSGGFACELMPFSQILAVFTKHSYQTLQGQRASRIFSELKGSL